MGTGGLDKNLLASLEIGRPRGPGRRTWGLSISKGIKDSHTCHPALLLTS